jgi:hypothetical protein
MTDTVQNAAIVDDDVWDESEYVVQRMEWVHAAKKRPLFIKYSNARDVNDETECEGLEQQNPYLATLFNEEGPCQYTEYQQYLRLIVYWLRCVRDDKPYGAFCDAIKAGPDSDEVKKIASPGAFIYDFYNDWGDVRGVQDEMKWIKSNYHLFLPEWIEAVEPGTIVPSGVIAVSGPDGPPKPEYIDSVFWTLCDRGKGADQGKGAKSKAKYQIEKVRGETFAETAQRLHVSSYVYDKLDFWDESIRSVARQYLGESELFKGMRGDNYEPMADGTLDRWVENNRKTIRRWKETHELCTAKAVTKSFPPKHTNTKA